MTTTGVPGEAIEAAAALLRKTGTPGAAIALKMDDAAVVTAGVGCEDLAGTRSMVAGGRFPLYSITKTILAAAVLRLVDAHRLTLDEDARELVPDVDLPAAITLRQLLGHTAGLPDYGGLPGYAADLRADPGTPWTDAEFLRRTLGRGLLFAPGEGWAYSNVGYLLVRRIVETVAGAGLLATALEHLVFAPAGVHGPGVATSPADMAALVPGYSRQLDDGDDPRDVRSRYHPGWVAHGLVTATAADTAALLAAMFDGGLLAPAALAGMLRGVSVGGSYLPFQKPGYGLGLMIDLEPEVARIAGHAGGGPGYATAAFRFETAGGRRATCVALANRDAGDIGLRIAFATARIALGLPH